MTPGGTLSLPGGGVAEDDITWTAAAKPFGYLEGNRRPVDFGIVLPAFREVALIPVDAASSGSGGGGFDLAWRYHVEAHLPLYMEGGPDALDTPECRGCYYCAQLRKWENEEFRETGIAWLEINYERCIVRRGDGGGGGGGGGGRPVGGGGKRRRGH